ncbi:hypothetical protein EPR50_G00196960 [Perca flavescens]|uniref:Uncharacterized protein n=1 Tax=Perca flavescens TaxID=8167 RepID=A0A484C6W9_PERFV|nr:hypothetical protein EPR50_G00196960 [Perca flavescens]
MSCLCEAGWDSWRWEPLAHFSYYIERRSSQLIPLMYLPTPPPPPPVPGVLPPLGAVASCSAPLPTNAPELDVRTLAAALLLMNRRSEEKENTGTHMAR